MGGRAGGLLRVVPVVVRAVGAAGALETEAVADLAVLIAVRFGGAAAFSLGGVGLDSVVGCSMLGIDSSIADGQSETRGLREW